MNRKTLLALGAFVVLGIIAFVALRAPEKGERAADRARPIPALDAAQITTVDITKGGVTSTLKKEGENYRVVAPTPYAADASNAKGVWEGLGKMDVSDLVTDQAGKQAEFQVDDKEGIHVVAKHDAQVLADVIVGKAVGAGTMVRLPGKNEIWQASGITRYTFDKPAADWRDKSISTFTAADVEKLNVAAKDGSKIALKKTGTKEGSEDKWQVVESSVKIDKLDNATANGLVSALSSWKANDFADGVKLADAGLEPAALTITVGLKDNKSITVLLGGKKGDDEIYAKKSDAPQVFLVKKYNIDRVEKAPIEFRDKTLCNIDGADVTDISVSAGDKSYALVKSGADWKATKPKMDVDSSKVTPITNAFKDWKAASFAEDQSTKNNGLAKPKVISAKSKDKGAAACVVKVGDESKDKLNYYVATTKGDVMLAPKWSVDRILVKPDDLKKPTVAKK
ncbi:MAG TPA: DUF4340 domain-containing protein [Polyangia bacterium]|nr:DUF4340 domain-containing protein [Polyangia bacterium]